MPTATRDSERGGTSRYMPLGNYLVSVKEESLRMAFDDVARIVGGLPEAAFKYREWWANSQPQPHARHGWLYAGWKTTQVDMQARTLVFVRQTGRDLISPFAPPAETVEPGTAKMPEGQRRDLQSAIEKRAGGLQNLWVILLAIEQYSGGSITEMELGQLIRRRWPRDSTPA